MASLDLLSPEFALPPKPLIHTFSFFTTSPCPSSSCIVSPTLCLLSSYVRLWFQTFFFLPIFSPLSAFSFLFRVAPPWSIISTTFLPISGAFALLHPALDRYSCLLCTCRLLSAARKKTTVLHVGAPAYSWSQPQLGLHCCPTFSLLLVSSSSHS